jgi:hypothetical protein
VLQGVGATAERANLALISAGVAFFGLMAVIPGIAAVVAFVGIFGDPAWIGDQIRALGGVAPDAVVTIIHDQVMRLLAQSSDELAWGALFNLVLALWSALQGTRWVLMALTAVNRRAEKRRASGTLHRGGHVHALRFGPERCRDRADGRGAGGAGVFAMSRAARKFCCWLCAGRCLAARRWRWR